MLSTTPRFFLVFSAFTAVGQALYADKHDSWLCCDKEEQEPLEDCNCTDRVHDFPGWTSRQPLPSPWYSGYLSYDFEGRTIHTHYILVLAEEDDDPYEEKPLLYWSNGGPGASSMFGLLSELGPLILSDESLKTDEYRNTGIPTPIYNPYSWSKLGHIVLIDQPAPVGFSYCEMNNTTTESGLTEEGHDSDVKDSPVDCAGLGWTDELAASNAFTALQTFYKQYPKFLGKDLYLTGESYAGIYIPTLARAILQANDKQDDDTDDNVTLPLKGFAVGDGCLGTQTGICQILDPDSFDFWYLFFLAGHNQIPLNSFQDILRACQPFDDQIEFVQKFPNTDICKAAVEKAQQEAGGVYAYGLYDDCTYRNGMMKRTHQLSYGHQGLKVPLTGGLNDYPCGGDVVLESYVKLPSVREAFHVGDTEYYNADNAVGFAYTPTEPDLTGFYKDVALNTNLSILVYNGDTDPAITSFATQNWTSHLGLSTIESWRPWTLDGCQRMGGHVTRYEGSLDFLTIRGSGHMVPLMKPASSFVFLKTWLQSKDYPTFVPVLENCTDPLRVDEMKAMAAQEDTDEFMKPYLRTAS